MASNDAEFALRETIACWDQAYEALVRGDLERVEALLEIAGENLERAAALGSTSALPPELHAEATSARGRLEHAMHAGLQGLREELSRSRQGGKALRGYGQAQGAARAPGLLT